MGRLPQLRFRVFVILSFLFWSHFISCVERGVRFVKPLSFPEFSQIYGDAVRVVLEHWTPAMQAEIARHNVGWETGAFDFRNYLEASAIRFYLPYLALADRGMDQKICDIGSHWGVWPMTLRSLGYDVAMTEALQFYGDSLRRLFDRIAETGVIIYDFDPFAKGATLPETFDFITVLAVLEHYPHSLKTFMRNAKMSLNMGGRLYLEVPNIAYWPKRLRLLMGRTPLASIRDIFESETPFIGHHHEFTIAELRDLASLSDLSILQEYFYNYSPGPKNILKRLVRGIFSVQNKGREVMAVLCEDLKK